MGEDTIPCLSGTAGRRTSYDCLFCQVLVTVGGTAPSLYHSGKATAPSQYQSKVTNVLFLSLHYQKNRGKSLSFQIKTLSLQIEHSEKQ